MHDSLNPSEEVAAAQRDAARPPAREIQGWYLMNATSEPVRVRLAIEGRSLLLHTLSGRLAASWSLDRLETRETAVLGEHWSIGDRSLPEASLDLENDRDYRDIRTVASGLRPVGWRLVGQFRFAAVESGNLTGWPVFLLLGAGGAVYWLWQNLPLAYCIANHRDTILFLKCLIIDHFIP